MNYQLKNSTLEFCLNLLVQILKEKISNSILFYF